MLEAGHPAGGDRPGRIHRAVGRPAAGPHRHPRHAHVGGRRGPAVCGEAGRAVHAQSTSSLTAIARRHLRQEYLTAEHGHLRAAISALADTGTLVRGGKRGERRPLHLRAAGPRGLDGHREDMPRMEYLPLFLNLLARSGTGQKLTTLHPSHPRPAPGQELYMILLDNGRTNVLKDPAAPAALDCIRCGACLNACPVFRRVGGWAYGWVYPGPDRLDPHAASGRAGQGRRTALRLVAVRGVRRGLPGENRHSASIGPPPPSGRQRALADEFGQRAADVEALGLGDGRPDSLQADHVRGAAGGALARFLPWHPGKLGAWTRGRELPQPSGPAFRSWWKRRKR